MGNKQKKKGRNMMEKVLEILKSHVGYLEKKSNQDLDDKTKNAGSNNYTCFARDYKMYTGENYQGQAWCAMFVSCCFVSAYGLELAKKLLGGKLYAYCPYGMTAFKNKGQLYSTPKAGDIVFFLRNGVAKHTGVVVKVSGNTIYTIEGNTSGASGVVANGGGVCQKSYTVTSSMLFGRPDYSLVGRESPSQKEQAESSQPKSSQTEAKPQMDSKNAQTKVDSAQSKDNSLAGTYLVTASRLNLRSGAGTDKSIVDVLNKGEKVQCYGYYTSVSGTKWLFVAAGTRQGFASGKYLEKV